MPEAAVRAILLLEPAPKRDIYVQCISSSLSKMLLFFSDLYRSDKFTVPLLRCCLPFACPLCRFRRSVILLALINTSKPL